MYSKRRITRLPDESLRDCLLKAPQELITDTVLAESGFTFKQACEKTRAAKTIMVRHLIHYLLSVNPERSFNDIGQLLCKDHGTVINSRNEIENMMYTNREFRLRLITLITKIKNQI